MTAITITYRIKLSTKVTEVFNFQLDDKSGDLVTEVPANPPPWVALDYKQCSHCPLNKTEHPHCPIALQLHTIIERFHNTSSIDEVELEVITEERRVLQTLPLQRAIGSMLGLVSPTCGCPKMAYMKPMARFHLPLSSEEETLFRVTGMYLLSQHLFKKESSDKTVTDFSGLKAIYDDLHILNKAIATRLRGATESDSSKNAIALLDMYSNLMPMMIDDQLPELLSLFSAYQTQAPSIVATVADIPVVTAPELTLEPIAATSEPLSATASLPTIATAGNIPVVTAPELTLEPIAAVGEPLSVKAAREKTADELALEALMQEVSADELAELLGTQKDIVVKKPDSENDQQQKPRGRAVFKLSDD